MAATWTADRMSLLLGLLTGCGCQWSTNCISEQINQQRTEKVSRPLGEKRDLNNMFNRRERERERESEREDDGVGRLKFFTGM